ncbi:MAG: DedA family protein [Dehalococcoidia bacterium]|nr:DedA family protein [Dehalococcoidia bacterium]
MFDPDIIADWILEHRTYALIFVYIIGCIEAFIITGTFWSSIIMLIVATSLHEAEINLFAISIFATAGSFTGDLASYNLGKKLGPKIKKWKFVRKKEKFLQKSENMIKKFGSVAILIGRLTPAIRPYVPFLAGVAEMSNRRYIIAATLACIIWGIGLFFIILGIDKLMNYI